MTDLKLFTPEYYLDVPFDKKDEAKKLKCRWDPNWKLWYYKDKHDNIMEDENDELNKFVREYSIVFLYSATFDDKDFIKANGGKWNMFSKQWYAKTNNQELKKFS